MAKTIRQQVADIDAKITELTVKRTALQAQADAEVNFDHVVPEAVVEFKYGKGETAKTFSGFVVAVKLADPAVPKSAPQARVSFGEGFEAQVVTVYFAAITKVVSSPASPVEAAPVAEPEAAE